MDADLLEVGIALLFFSENVGNFLAGRSLAIKIYKILMASLTTWLLAIIALAIVLLSIYQLKILPLYYNALAIAIVLFSWALGLIVRMEHVEKLSKTRRVCGFVLIIIAGVILYISI